MSVFLTATDIARETLRLLASKRIEPTPENYSKIYNDIAGSGATNKGVQAEQALQGIAADFPRNSTELARVAGALDKAAAARDWDRYKSTLVGFARCQAQNGTPPGSAPTMLRDDSAALRNMLGDVLERVVAGRLGHAPQLAGQANSLARRVRAGHQGEGYETVGAELGQLLAKPELGAQADMLQRLLRLLRLLIENISELATDDQWLRGQFTVMLEIISNPLDAAVMDDAERSLTQAISSQRSLKHSLRDAKLTIKELVSSFIDRLGNFSERTGDYHQKIEDLSKRMEHTEDIDQLGEILEQTVCETRTMQQSTLRSRDDLVQARAQAEAAESKIRRLESELEQVSSKVREDQLTGMLNRRGLEDEFTRAIAASERRKEPLCVALLDIDNFKQLNDAHGHQAGDDALVHLANVIKAAVRPTDVIARYGGEEFLVLLPDSDLQSAIAVMTRLQRDLTKQFFLLDQRRLLITFSAGVELRATGESQQAIIARADKAMYEAKRNGKNRVVADS